MSFASIAIKTSIPTTATRRYQRRADVHHHRRRELASDHRRRFRRLGLALRAALECGSRRVASIHGRQAHCGQQRDAQRAFLGVLPVPQGRESFVLYDPASAITATASAARTGSPLAAPTPASSGAVAGRPRQKQDTGNASLVSIPSARQQTSTLATALRRRPQAIAACRASMARWPLPPNRTQATRR